MELPHAIVQECFARAGDTCLSCKAPVPEGTWRLCDGCRRKLPELRLEGLAAMDSANRAEDHERGLQEAENSVPRGLRQYRFETGGGALAELAPDPLRRAAYSASAKMRSGVIQHLGLVAPDSLERATALAVACFRMVLQPWSMFVHARRLGDAQREHALGRGHPPLLARAKRVPILAVDDVGSESNHEVLRDVLVEREHAGLATITTTALTADELVSCYGATDARRVFARGAIVTM